MSPFDRRALVSGFAALCAGLALACGGGEEEAAPPSGAGSPSAPAPSTPSAEEGKAGDELRYSGETQTGEEFQAQIGGVVELPGDFPDDIPRYPGATPTASLSAGKRGTFVSLDTSDDPSVVFDFYKNELPGSGWDIENEASFGGIHQLAAVKGDRKASLAFSTVEGSTRINIAVSVTE